MLLNGARKIKCFTRRKFPELEYNCNRPRNNVKFESSQEAARQQQTIQNENL